MLIGVFYIWHYTEDYNPSWQQLLRSALNLCLNRLIKYFGEDWEWGYTTVSEFQTSYPVGAGEAININCERAVLEWGIDYSFYNIPIFAFANMREAYSIDYKPPIYMSDDAFKKESQAGGPLLIEHEIMHLFGLPDHNQPYANPEYANCIMGNLYLPEIRFCSECLARLRPRGVYLTSGESKNLGNIGMVYL